MTLISQTLLRKFSRQAVSYRIAALNRHNTATASSRQFGNSPVRRAWVVVVLYFDQTLRARCSLNQAYALSSIRDRRCAISSPTRGGLSTRGVVLWFTASQGAVNAGGSQDRQPNRQPTEIPRRIQQFVWVSSSPNLAFEEGQRYLTIVVHCSLRLLTSILI